MLKAIIIDDEPYCCEILTAMLEADCPEVQIVSKQRKETLLHKLQPFKS